MDPRLIAFRNQVRFRLEPVLHIVAGCRTLVFIGEIGSPCHLIRGGNKGAFTLLGRGAGIQNGVVVVFMRMIVMFHSGIIVAHGTSRYGVLPD